MDFWFGSNATFEPPLSTKFSHAVCSIRYRAPAAKGQPAYCGRVRSLDALHVHVEGRIEKTMLLTEHRAHQPVIGGYHAGVQGYPVADVITRRVESLATIRADLRRRNRGQQ